MVKQLGPKKGRTVTHGFTFFRTILAGTSTEVVRCHTDSKAVDLDST